jgi:hypothetical protein
MDARAALVGTESEGEDRRGQEGALEARAQHDEELSWV